MTDPLHDHDQAIAALDYIAAEARRYLAELDQEPAKPPGADAAAEAIGGPLPESGEGTLPALRSMVEASLPAATRSAGPRFFHFVTGGATPAALAADWFTSTLDQNSFSWVSSPLGSQLEKVTVGWLKDLFRLPNSWGGVLTTGATMANFTALGAARRWWALEHGVDVDDDGLSGLPVVPVLASGYLHSSAVKALSMLGIGRRRIRLFSKDPSGLADVAAIDAALRELDGAPAIVVATIGEVNAGGFDPLEEMAAVARRHNAWLHVDGAFGLFARASATAADLARGLEGARSVIGDGHKWLNVPYDCGFAFVSDPALLTGAFTLTGAPYLPEDTDARPSFGDRGPEASRRARALAVWASLKAYGRNGIQEMVDRHIALAQRVGGQVEAAAGLELLAPVNLNVVCFRAHPVGAPEAELDELNRRIGEAVLAEGSVYFGTTVYGGRVAFRPAISNWRTTERDVDLIVPTVQRLAQRVLAFKR